MRTVLSYVLLLAAAAYLFNQVRKPTGWAGRFLVWIMNTSHSGVTDWGLSHLVVGRTFRILDVGCGGGRTIEKLSLIATAGKIYGVDYANGSVAVSRWRNAALIEAGRVTIQRASVSHLPFSDSSFDLVSAVETHYYWPNPAKDMLEILRVLKPGGTIVVIAESYKRSSGGLEALMMKLLRAFYLSAEEHRDLLTRAGYTDVQVFEKVKKGWICVIGKKLDFQSLPLTLPE